MVMGDADRQKITDHFRAKINRARERSQMEATPATYSELMREALDFRNWFTFRLFYQKGGAEKQTKKELTDSAFNSFSGGEKAMAMYVPLFAALAAQYAAANHAEAPRLMALDEAFAGVDETNIESMFALVHELGFDYIMNSQALWGCYPTVQSFCRTMYPTKTYTFVPLRMKECATKRNWHRAKDTENAFFLD